MAQSFQVFHDTYIGTAHDVDGSAGYQCWDGYAFYDQWLGYAPIYCTATGGARDLWEQRATNGMLDNHDIVTGNLQNGDIGVWGANMGGGYGHVAMYYNGKWMGQNQNGVSAYTDMTIAQSPMGSFRPKCYKDGPGGTVRKLKITCVYGIVTKVETVEVPG